MRIKSDVSLPAKSRAWAAAGSDMHGMASGGGYTPVVVEAVGGNAAPSDDAPVAIALRTCVAIVEDLMRDPAASIFCRPVDPERDKEDFTMSDYLEVISEPMDLGCVMRNYTEGQYASAQLLREDVVQASVQSLCVFVFV